MFVSFLRTVEVYLQFPLGLLDGSTTLPLSFSGASKDCGGAATLSAVPKTEGPT